MSEPMSNVEIEDVLSSIRRLVSENATRPGTYSDELESEVPARAAPADALVLTESLRVEEPELAAAPAPEEMPPEPEAAAEAVAEAEDEIAAESDGEDETALDASWEEVASPERALWDEAETFEFDSDAGEAFDLEADLEDALEDDTDPLQSRVEGLEAAFDTGEDFEPDGSEVAATEENFDWEEGDEDTVIDLSTPEVPSGTLLFMRSASARDAKVAAEAAPETTADTVERDAGDTLEAADDYVEAALEEEWPEPEEDWTAPDLPRPEGAAEQPVFRSAHRTHPAEEGDALSGQEPDAAGESRDEIEDAELVEADPAEVPFRHAAAANDDTPQDAELLVDEQDDEEDEDGVDELEGFAVGTERGASGQRLHFSSAHEPDPWEDGTGIDESALTAALNDPEPPALIDEARLVELVSDVVREELRGAMGDRITQNVRKLVRREIARALETRGIR